MAAKKRKKIVLIFAGITIFMLLFSSAGTFILYMGSNQPRQQPGNQNIDKNQLEKLRKKFKKGNIKLTGENATNITGSTNTGSKNNTNTISTGNNTIQIKGTGGEIENLFEK